MYKIHNIFNMHKLNVMTRVVPFSLRFKREMAVDAGRETDSQDGVKIE